MYLFIATLTKIDHLTKEEAMQSARKARGEGKRSAILTEEEAKSLGLFEPMPDLTKLP